MFIEEDEKEDRKEALASLMKMMKSGVGKKLSGIRKPSVEIEIEAEGPEEEMEEMGEMRGMKEMGDEMEPSEDEKMKIAELYHKYCK